MTKETLLENLKAAKGFTSVLLIEDMIKLIEGLEPEVKVEKEVGMTEELADKLFEKIGARSAGKAGVSKSSNLVIPMVLAIILDGVPESIVIGLGIFEGGKVSMAMLVAVFIANLPEAIAGSTGMKANGWKTGKIIILWIIIAVICAISTVAGFSLFSGASADWMAFIQAFAGGAILIVLSNSMIPESYEHGGKIAGLFTVLGFFISVSIIILENY